jgi:predicted nuclease of predicted toxin-antitoxin system
MWRFEVVMRFKLDENLPWSISNIMIDYGYDVETVLSEGLNGCSDDKLINTCTREQRILITLDYDFADILAYPPQTYAGIIVIRAKNQNKSQIQVLITKLLILFEDYNPAGSLWIVEEDRVRIRK